MGMHHGCNKHHKFTLFIALFLVIMSAMALQSVLSPRQCTEPRWASNTAINGRGRNKGGNTTNVPDRSVPEHLSQISPP